MIINNAKLKNSIMSCNSRLIERQLYLSIFEKKPRFNFFKSISCYQNEDGGFGNGIEPDLMTPESSSIALETALYYYDCISYIPKNTAAQILNWIAANLNDDGYINHPPESLENYPFQPWWSNPDNDRILSILGLLVKMRINIPDGIKKRVFKFAQRVNNKVVLEEYDYPIYIFSLYCTDFPDRDKYLKGLKDKIIDLSSRKQDHYIIFTRYWKFFSLIMDEDFKVKETERILNKLNSDNPMSNLYEDLPWWNSIFLLDYLISLKHFT